MKIEKGNYIRAAEFSNEEIDVFIGLTGIDVNDSDSDSEKRDGFEGYEHYGLDGFGDLVNWNNPENFGDLIIDQKDITQEFRDYINALSVEKKDDDEWTHVTNSGYKCKIALKEPDANNNIIVLRSDGVYRLHNLKTLKPIKQAIKPSAAWSLVSEQGWSIHEVNEKYDVVEKD